MSDKKHCRVCGYTKEDQQTHGDHHLCKNAGKAPWEISADAARRVKVEILKCKHCPRLIVAINDTRIFSHKCAGQWTVLTSEQVPVSRILQKVKP